MFLTHVIRWLRVSAPPRWTPLLLFPCLIQEAVYFWSRWRGVALDDLLLPRDVCLLMAAAVLGAFRVWAVHPLFHRDYRTWLGLTPWSSRLPLPLGPIHLVPQDTLWLVIVLALWHDPQVSRFYLPIAFLLSYLALVCFSCAAVGMPAPSYLLAFGLGDAVRRWHEPQASLVILGWLYLAAWLAIRRMLARFPWIVSWYWDQPSMQAVADEMKQRMMGFPIDQLHGRPSDPRIGLLDGTLVSLLVGWWSYCVNSLASNPFRQIWMWQVLCLVTVAAIAQRSVAYCLDHRPPISFWGRVWTLHWIIPRYDHILVTPVLIFLVARYMPEVLTKWQLPPDTIYPVTTSLVLLLACDMPPAFERWRLTGYHRIVPGGAGKQEFVQL